MTFCTLVQSYFCNIGKGHNEEHFFEIILNLDQLSFKGSSYLRL